MQFIYEGEIVKAVTSPLAANKLCYACNVIMESGDRVYLPYVHPCSMFGGIADYLQLRSRQSETDDSDQTDFGKIENYNGRIGDRVYIAFVGGSIHNPIIVGYAQHPSQIDEFADPVSEKPRLVFQYAGVRATIDSLGQLTVIHQGAPEILEVEPPGPEQGELSEVAGLLSDAPSAGSPTSDAMKPADVAGMTLFEFLQDGVFRVRDSEGQIFEMDRTKGRIYISNNDLKSTDDPDGGPLAPDDAEFILIDKNEESLSLQARSLIAIHSLGDRQDETDGNYTHEIGGDNTWNVNGNETIVIDGTKEDSINGDWFVDVTASLEISQKGGSKLNLSGGKVALGNGVGELLEQISMALEKCALAAAQAADVSGNVALLTVGTGTGPSSPPTNAADFTKLATDLQQTVNDIFKIQAAIDGIRGPL